jgi:bifunctional UDP-N-acetylglucosamine pyrophosphorylase/glucosamine-1-phosphate N-acetyltransferase
MTPRDLFAVDAVAAELRPLLEVERPWQILVRLDAFVQGLSDYRAGRIHPSAVIEGPIHLAEGATIGPHAYVQGPAWIGRNAEVGHGAHLRGNVVLAPDVRVMHASEVKHALLLEGVRLPHFNYVGDSVLGRGVNLGAGVKLANFKVFGDGIVVAGEATGLRKFGAALGDDVSVGCNAVLAPGTVIGPRSIVYHGATVRGVVPADTVVKLRQTLEHAPRRG